MSIYQLREKNRMRTKQNDSQHCDIWNHPVQSDYLEQNQCGGYNSNENYLVSAVSYLCAKSQNTRVFFIPVKSAFYSSCKVFLTTMRVFCIVSQNL